MSAQTAVVKVRGSRGGAPAVFASVWRYHADPMVATVEQSSDGHLRAYAGRIVATGACWTSGLPLPLCRLPDRGTKTSSEGLRRTCKCRHWARMPYLLRREGLYSSLIAEWRKQRDQGALQALGASPGRPPGDTRDQEIAGLRRENARLQSDLAKARKVIEVQGKPLRAAGAARHWQRGSEWRRAQVMVDQTIGELAPVIGKRAACAALGRSRATYYRRHRQSPAPPRPRRKRLPHPRALNSAERAEVLRVLHEERFVDQAPASVYASLLDEGRYLCSVPTMYRLLRAEDEVRERRRQATHPASIKPELVALGPNQVWSWDITKLVDWLSKPLGAKVICRDRDGVYASAAERGAPELATMLPRPREARFADDVE
jgi:hypothetical protein